jgi:O-antigen ligase
MFIAVFPFLSARLKMLLLVTLLMSLWLFAVFGLFFPDYFSGDENNHWRLMVWRNNLKSMWDSYLLGVGFGTPYHPLTTQNLINTMRNSFDSVSVALTDPVEPQYVRGQHSSFINIFYRMGIVGGLLFITLSLTPIVIAVRQSFCRGRSDGGLLLAAVALYVLQLVQMTVHVGIEAPRFLVLYMLSAQFVLNTCTREQLD